MKRHLLLTLMTVALAACQESLDEKAAKEAALYTRKNCPAQIGNNLRMDSLTFESATRTLHYYYTLSGVTGSFSGADSDKARQALLTELKNTTSMISYKEAGFSFAYTYHALDRPSDVLFETVFTPKDYGQK